MNCPNCGALIEKPGAKYCEFCGKKITAGRGIKKIRPGKNKEASNGSVYTYVLKCKSCGGTLSGDPDSGILVCPYCGSRELIEESDAVKIAKMQKEVELGRQKILEQQLKNEHDKNEVRAFAKSRSFKAAVILLVLSLFGSILAFPNYAYASGIVALIQIGLTVFAILAGFRIVSPKIRKFIIPAVLGAAILILPYICLVGYSSYHSSLAKEELDWDNVIMADALPDPGCETGRIYTNTTEKLSFDADPYTAEEFKAYVNACQDAGYTTDRIMSSDNSFEAYNEEGYHVDLYYFRSDGYLSAYLDAPIEMSDFIWPAHGLPKYLPAPESGVGKIVSDSAEYFYAYIGETSKAEYSDYVTAVIDAGFDQDYYLNDTSFSGENAEGIKVSINYEGFQTMGIRITHYES